MEFNALNVAPHGPGEEPRWSPSAKDGIGTAYHGACRLWFTLARGIITEIYCPTVDTPNTRSLRFLITDGASFFHDEEYDLEHSIEMPEKSAFLYRQTNKDRQGRYQIIKEIVAEPHSSVLVVRVRFEIKDESLRGKLRLYAFLEPHLGGHGMENKGKFCNVGKRSLLHAEREDFHLALGCHTGFAKRSVGYLGTSDGRSDLNDGKFQMDWEYDAAGPGAIALTGEIDLANLWEEEGCTATFILGAAFGDSEISAVAKLLQAFACPFDYLRKNFISQWERATIDSDLRQRVSAHTGDEGFLFGLSHRVLLAHEDKNFQGALVASLSTPWGEAKTDKDSGGYHLVWTRDLVQSASALLASGEIATPLRALLWLTCIQNENGSFPQNSWIDGRPYWEGIQIDEMAAPLLLGWRLWKTSPDDFDRANFGPVLRSAAAYLLGAGPVTDQDRWEENAGYSPSTLATVIAALCGGAELARAHQRDELGEVIQGYADWLNARLEDWCVTTAGELVLGKRRHYVRITPADRESPDPSPDPDKLEVDIANGGGRHPVRNIISGDFLHLVRLGLRPPDDPLILDSLAVCDAALKHDLPGGPGWRRYPFDGYGQKADGTAFDGTGEGRCWPILTGERGHYELAAGRDAGPYIQAMEKFANVTGLLPEQVWDAADIPEHNQLLGHPSGSATPLCWTHAEYLSLVRSRLDGRVFDRIEPAYQRYVVQGLRNCTHEHWLFRYQTRSILAGRQLRIFVRASARVRWSFDSWSTFNDSETKPVGFGQLHLVDLPTDKLEAGRQIEWTFYWPEADCWENQNFQARIEKTGRISKSA